jgi:hypothetical protein
MLANLTAYVITSAARLITGARALWLGCSALPVQRLYFANHSSHGDFVLLWASLPQVLRQRTRPVPAQTTGPGRASATFLSAMSSTGY